MKDHAALRNPQWGRRIDGTKALLTERSFSAGSLRPAPALALPPALSVAKTPSAGQMVDLSVRIRPLSQLDDHSPASPVSALPFLFGGHRQLAEHPSRRPLLALQLRRLTNNPAFPCRDGANTYLHTSRSRQADDSWPQTSWKGRQGNRTRLWRRTAGRAAPAGKRCTNPRSRWPAPSIRPASGIVTSSARPSHPHHLAFPPTDSCLHLVGSPRMAAGSWLTHRRHAASAVPSTTRCQPRVSDSRQVGRMEFAQKVRP